MSELKTPEQLAVARAAHADLCRGFDALDRARTEEAEWEAGRPFGLPPETKQPPLTKEEHIGRARNLFETLGRSGNPDADLITIQGHIMAAGDGFKVLGLEGAKEAEMLAELHDRVDGRKKTLQPAAQRAAIPAHRSAAQPAAKAG
jgi:hypothetical protein